MFHDPFHEKRPELSTEKKEEKSPYMEVNLAQLFPNSPAPCDIFIKFKGKLLPLVKHGGILSSNYLLKLRKAGMYHGHIEKLQGETWTKAQSLRGPICKWYKIYEEKLDRNVSMRISQYVKFAQSKIRFVINEGIFRKVGELGQNQYKEFLKDPALNWYFQKEWDESNWQHSARVSYLTLLFLFFLKDLLKEQDKSDLITSIVVHELKGDPKNFLQESASANTLKYLLEKKVVFPSEVIRLIEMQDELADGSGVPNKLRGNQLPESIKIFMIVNFFDHCRLLDNNPSSKQQKANALKKLLENKEKYDEAILGYFFKFMEAIDVHR